MASFGQVLRVLEFGSYWGKRCFPGLWWSCTISDQVGCVSWLERLVHRPRPRPGITAIAPTSGASRRWTPPGCGPPRPTPSSVLEDSLTGDRMRAVIQMAAGLGKGVYRRRRGLPGVLQAPLDPRPEPSPAMPAICTSSALHRHGPLVAP